MNDDRFLPYRSINNYDKEVKFYHQRLIIGVGYTFYKAIIKQLIDSNNGKLLYYSKCSNKNLKTLNNALKRIWDANNRQKRFCINRVEQTFFIYDVIRTFKLDRYCEQSFEINMDEFLTCINNNTLYFINPFEPANKPLSIKCPFPLSGYFKWNLSGKIVSLLARNRTEIYEYEPATKKYYASNCACMNCLITVLAWRGNYTLLSGCSNGSVSIWENRIFKWNIQLNDTPVRAITFSNVQPNYFAVVHDDSDLYIFQWPIKLICNFTNATPILAWHPWQIHLLCGVTKKGSIVIINVFKRVPDFILNSPGTVHAVTWNELSGELVVSKTHNDKNHLIVCSNNDDVVENVTFHRSTTPYLLWSLDRSVLLSIDVNGTVALWKFFGASSKLKKHTKKSISIHDYNFGYCVR